jgi:NADH-quinone oxidoreductase subunit M
LTPREVLTFVPLIIMAFWIGLYPKPFFQILEQPVNQLVQTVRPDYPLPRGVVNTTNEPAALAVSAAVAANPPTAVQARPAASVKGKN